MDSISLLDVFMTILMIINFFIAYCVIPIHKKINAINEKLSKLKIYFLETAITVNECKELRENCRGFYRDH